MNLWFLSVRVFSRALKQGVISRKSLFKQSRVVSIEMAISPVNKEWSGPALAIS